MKSKISAKKVFAIIGIVFGSVLAFVGTVFGVMAAMGKFKTPIVYPSYLEFASEKVITAGKPYGDPTVKSDIYSFTLVGTNSSYKDEVNKKVCYIWFDKGSDLITLCNKDGVPLQKTKDNKYQVNCNEPIYYMVNKVDDNYITDGIVQIKARSENNKATTNEPLTMYIDRKIDSIYLNRGNPQTWVDGNQTTTVGVGIGFDFNYVINPIIAQKPIDHVDYTTKVPELYFVATGYSDDYLLVTEEEINKEASPLHDILTYNNGKITFKSSTAGTYQFKIAVFPTYESRDRFSLDNQANIEQNFKPLTNVVKLSEYMTVTTLNVKVENIDVSSVDLLGSNVVLNLYSENDYITLDGTSGVENAKNNNLELVIKKGEGQASIEDTTRFDEVEMKKMPTIEYSAVTPIFKSSSTELKDVTITSSMIEESYVDLGNAGVVIDYIDYNGGVYYCVNGMAVWKDADDDAEVDAGEIKLISSGVYLDFYYGGDDGKFTLASDFEYEVKAPINSEKTKSWNIISKQLIDADKDLYLGIVVINSNTSFDINKLFATIPVTVNEVDLEYEILNKTKDLDITFDAEGNEVYSNIEFENLINITNGSYNATVLVVEEQALPFVNTISNIKFSVNDITYLLVGYQDETTKEFVNKVEVNTYVSNGNKSCNLYMLQLKNDYKEVLSDIITKGRLNNTSVTYIFTDKKDVTSTTDTHYICDKIKELHNEAKDTIVINSKYILNKDILKCSCISDIDDETTEIYEVYENTDIKLVVEPDLVTSMIAKIQKYYAINTDNKDKFFDTTANNIVVDNIEPNEEVIIVNLTASAALNDENTEIVLTLNNIPMTGNEGVIVNGSLQIAVFKVLSSAPKNIVFNTEDHQITLASSIEEAKNSSNYIKAVVEYSQVDGFGYKYYLNGDTEKEITTLLNEKISSSTAVGFQDALHKGKEHDITYTSNNEEIFKINEGTFEAVKAGEDVLIVTISGTTKYVKIVVDSSAFKLYKSDDTEITANATDTVYSMSAENPTTLGSILKLKYNGTEIAPLNSHNKVFVKDVKVSNYGDGILTVEKTDSSFKLLKGTTEILTMIETNGYTFDYKTPYIPLNIRLTMQTVLQKNIEISIAFTSTVNVSVNTNWVNNRVFYAGTNVQLWAENEPGEAEVAYKPVFDIVGSSTVSFTVNGTEVSSKVFTVTDNFIGPISIDVLINDSKAQTFTDFVVKPNVVATLKEGLNLTSNMPNIAYGSIYDVSSYDTTKTYGDDSSLYTDTPTGTPSGLTLKVENDSLLSVNAAGELSIGHLTELNKTVTKTIYLMYGTHKVVESEITISNSITANTSNTGENETLTYVLWKVYNHFATVDGYSLESITATNIEFDDISNFTIKNITNTDLLNTLLTDGKLENVEITLTFKNTSNADLKVSYKQNVTIVPYTPQKEASVEKAYSGAKYDLLNDVYDVTNWATSETNIKSLVISNIYDKNKNSIVNDIIASGTINNGYIVGNTSPHCEIYFKDIVGPSKTIIIEYTLTYNNNVQYVYEYEIILNNRQKIERQYPESDLTLKGTYKFLNNDAAKEITGANEIVADGVYYISEDKALCYEPILISSSNTTKLNLLETDAYKKVQRFAISNASGIDLLPGISAHTNLIIEIVAYETTSGMANYVETNNKVKIETDNVIAFGSATNGFNGTIIFKVSTVSGNYMYYIVKVYASSSVELQTMDVVACNGTNNYLGCTSSKCVDETNHISIGTDEINYYNFVKNNLVDSGKLFGKTYDSYTSLYLYKGETLGGTFDYPLDNSTDDVLDDTKQWKKLTADDTFKATAQFQTITLGVYYNYGSEYVYGIITIYVQPKNNVSTSGLSYEKPNGEFTKNVDANLLSVDCPLEGTWAASVITLDANAECSASEDATDSSKINISNHVSKPTRIVVKYTNSGTTVYVTYTYLATTVPQASTTTIGKFIDEDDGFNKTIDLASSIKISGVSNLDKYFGTYVPDGSPNYSITSKDANCTASGTVLTFTQTHEQQEIQVTITYNNLKDINGESETRTFTFIVLPGIYIDTTSTNSNSGLSQANVKPTVLTDDYTSADAKAGSKLTFDKTPGTVTKYKVGELIIYTNVDSYLELTVAEEDQKYVTNLSSGKVTINKDEETINFVHLAQDKNININISVYNKSASKKYIDHTFFARISKSYSTIKANYLVDGATHENDYDKVEDLHETLLGTSSGRTRIVLIGNGGNIIDSANLSNMGFAEVGNPNYIDFNCNDNGTLKYTYDEYGKVTQVDIDFATVDANTPCEVFLNNQAGIEQNSVKYTYQIMKTSTLDGLDYSSTDGVKNGSTLTFVINDTNKNNAFVIGDMLDTKNKTVFDLTPATLIGKTFYFDKTNSALPVYYYNGNVKTLASSGYIGNYVNAIQHKLTNGVYITANFDAGTIELMVSTAADYDFTINASGVNGETNPICSLNIKIYNYKVAIDDPEETIYSGFEIDLDEKISVKSGTNYATKVSGLTYKFNRESYYEVTGQEPNTTITNVVSFDGDRPNILNVHAIGVNEVLAHVVFDIKKDDVIIAKVEYTFTINRNFHFVANGEEMNNTVLTKTPFTNFVLNTANDKDVTVGFPLRYNFVDVTKMNLNESDGSTNKKTVNGVTYYNVLGINLYRPYARGTTDIQTAKIDRFNIKLHSNHSEYVTVTNDYIEFKKDFTGDIELELYVPTDVGIYSVIWNISVKGILIQEYVAKEDVDYARVYDASSAFDSGSTVSLFASTSGNDNGVIVNKPPTFETTITDKNSTTTGEITYKYTYKIIEKNSTTEELTNKQLFENAPSEYLKSSGSGSDTFGTSQLNQQIILPNVPATLDKQSYFVVYEFYLEYLGLTYSTSLANNKVQVFYITYDVINKQTVNTYNIESTDKSSADVDVDSRFILAKHGADGYTEDQLFRGYWLPLFKFKESISLEGVGGDSADIVIQHLSDTVDDGNVFAIDYSDGLDYLYNDYRGLLSSDNTIQPKNYDSSLSWPNYADLKTASVKIDYNLNTITLTRNNNNDWGDDKNTSITYKIKERELEQQEFTPTFMPSEMSSYTSYPVFKAGFDNTIEYWNFLKNYINKPSVVLTDENEVQHTFRLGSITSTADAIGIRLDNDGGVVAGGELNILTISGDGEYTKQGNYFVYDSTYYYFYNAKLYSVTNYGTTGETKTEIAGTWSGTTFTSGGTKYEFSNNGSKLFDNEMRAKLALVDNGVEAVVVDAYTDKNISGFRLYTDNKIEAKTKTKVNQVDVEGIPLNQIFLKKYFTTGSEYYDKEIIGVGTPSNTWVTGATGTPATVKDPTNSSKELVFAEIKIPNGTGTNIYYLKKVTFNGTGGANAAVYNVKKDYYYIDLNGNSGLVLPDYGAVGIENSWFKINYAVTSGKVEIDLTKAIKVWNTDTDGVLKYKNASSFADFNASSDATTLPTLDTTTNKKITIEASVLDAYKVTNPNVTNYPKVTATIKADDVTLKFDIEFMLDQYAKVNANYTTGSTNDITKSLVDAISYKAEDGYEVLSNSIKMYKYDSSNSKLLSVDGATTIVETWTNDKFTDGNETVYQLIKDGEGTVTQLKVGDKTYDLKDGYFITSNLSMVTSITEKGGNGYLKSYDTTSGEIKFDGVKVDDYFKTHIGANELTFICTITSAYGSYDFQVVITKTI